jgi:RNA polymerase sigma factor
VNYMKDILFSGTLNKRVLGIQSNPEEIEVLIREYKPFILSTAQKCTYKNYITEQDDEYSIALIAFNEAVKAYREEKGAFLSFAKSVIRMRCIDYYRKEKKHTGNNLSLDGDDGETTDNSLIYSSIMQYEEDETAQNRALEIEQYRQELEKWSIRFSELVRVSPKHAKTRAACKKIVDYLTGNKDKLEYVLKKQMLPIADIEKALRIPRKQTERLRKYIIAVLIIKNGDYPFLNEYVKDWGNFNKIWYNIYKILYYEGEMSA